MAVITTPDAVDSTQPFDFIVVGGGTAGCALAGRLASNPSSRILIIEAGVGNPQEISDITTPGHAFDLRDGPNDWRYKTTMIDREEYTRVEKPNTRGKVLGGSSGLNYFTWIPGSAATFDDWAAFGGEEWTWEKCRPYLSKPATYHDDEGLYPEWLKEVVGEDGPIPVAHAELVPELAPFREALEKAWVGAGEELTDDVHSGTMRGLWRCTTSIYKGKRSGSWLFLEGKDNVTVLSQTRSKRLVIENGRAVGIEVFGPDGAEYTFRAKHEVIVSQGVFESPKLLMLSGIGPRETLEKFKIPVVAESEHVGQHLLDHPILAHVFKLKDGLGLDHHLLRAGPEREAAVSAYRRHHTGPLASGLLEMVGLPRIDERLARIPGYKEAVSANGGKDPFGPGGQPHFEIDFVPMFADAFQWHIPTPPSGDYLTVIVDLLRPMSQDGTVTLKSTDATEQPEVNLNFFSNKLDVAALREGVRWVDDIVMHGEGMKEIVGDDYPWPMPRSSDAAMDKMILERSQTGFHPCGTNRIGKSVEQGVVDSKLRVFGVEALRVIDASVFPVIPDCRIQNAVYMVAEKGADIIKAAYPELYSS